MIFQSKNQNGFSLVETLVAISILLIIIAGPMAISSSTAKSSSFASEQVQAFFLAQEGAEMAQKLKNELLVAHLGSMISDPWGQFADTNGAYANCFKSTGCGLEWDDNNTGELIAPIDCTLSGTPCRLYYNNDITDRSQFTHTGTDETPFTRRIYFTTGSNGLDATREVYVRSVVTWRTGSIVADQKIEVDTYLYNIYDTE